jgi:hypothetical protein
MFCRASSLEKYIFWGHSLSERFFFAIAAALPFED